MNEASPIANDVRVGVDIGGTFTDVALEHGAELFSTKVLTDYQAPERAILLGISQVLQKAGLEPQDIRTVIHGTTLATNALIERSGARTAFVTTQGFRDVIEMRTENRFEQYDLNITLPPALIERCDRYVLKERIGASGNVLVTPSPAAVEELIVQIQAGRYDSIAIGFLHSYANPAHEILVREAMQRALPGTSISISSEVSPQIREFERFNTVCANAYVKPMIKSYLDRLEAALRGMACSCPVYMIHSGGGIISLRTAAEFPVRLVESGPAGGAIFAAHIAKRHGIDRVLSFDMGGTTAKICLIDDYAPQTAKTFEVARTYRFKKGSGMPISIPVVEMVEIGAGGGSIASVDAMRQIRVGPKSAGSEPGPACYGRGGASPTVTDADLVLGALDPHYFAGGAMELSMHKAMQAIERDVGGPLAAEAHVGAYGITEVVDENMSNAARVHAVESGRDIGDYTMITFGGAGPLHAARLCEKLGVKRFLVPPGAGVGSAIGFLRAPFGYESVRSHHQLLAKLDTDKLNALLDNTTEEAVAFARQGLQDEDMAVERVAYMRYVGQGWEIPVTMPARPYTADDAEVMKQLFTQAYLRFFSRPIAHLDIEIVGWSVKASSVTRPVPRLGAVGRVTTAPVRGQRRLFDAGQQSFITASVVHRDDLVVGAHLQGPAVVVERETATVVPAAFEVVVQPDHCLLVQVRETAPKETKQ